MPNKNLRRVTWLAKTKKRILMCSVVPSGEERRLFSRAAAGDHVYTHYITDYLTEFYNNNFITIDNTTALSDCSSIGKMHVTI